MVVDETTLRSFVDGELEPAQREQVEAVIAHSPELQAQVAALRASCLPYRTAFERQGLPEVPAGLQQRVASLLAVAQPVAASGPQRLSRRQQLGIGAALAASFAAGTWLPRRAVLDRAESPPWVQAIASYHALYVRETVVDLPADAAQRLNLLLDGFDGAQRAALFVPDLRTAGLHFKRVQRLGFHDLPLIQMVYLPADGRPLALCALPLAQADAPVRTLSIEGLSVASWQRRGLGFVLAADMPRPHLEALARQLVADQFAPL